MSAVTLSAVVHREVDLFVATCPEVGTVSQGSTIDEAISNLREATELYVEEVGVPATAGSVFLTTFTLDRVNAAAA